jgi:hypothetical protein
MRPRPSPFRRSKRAAAAVLRRNSHSEVRARARSGTAGECTFPANLLQSLGFDTALSQTAVIPVLMMEISMPLCLLGGCAITIFWHARWFFRQLPKSGTAPAVRDGSTYNRAVGVCLRHSTNYRGARRGSLGYPGQPFPWERPTELLAERGEDVAVLARAWANLRHLARPPVRIVQGHLRGLETLKSAMRESHTSSIAQRPHGLGIQGDVLRRERARH